MSGFLSSISLIPSLTQSAGVPEQEYSSWGPSSILIELGTEDTAEAKKKVMKECGIYVIDSPAEIGKKVSEVLS